MRYGSSSTVNVAISPHFLAKMANDPELEKEYEENIAAMQKCDEQFTQMQAARGWRVDAQGWVIDKDAGKEQFWDRFKEAIVLTSDDKETDAGRKEREKEAAVGINLDKKI